MNLVDLKRKSKEEKNTTATPIEVGADRYPYGTKLCFENEEIEKIDSLKDMDVNDLVQITAVGKICSKSVNEVEGKDDPSRRIEIQIQSIGISKEAEEKEEMTLETALEKAKTEIWGKTQGPKRSTAAHGMIRAKRAYQGE